MILFFLILGSCFAASAQITDLIGSLAVDGVITAQSVKGYNTANLQLKKNKIVQELQIKNMEIQTLMVTHPQNVSRETFSIAGYPASVQLENNNGFFITIKGIEKALCSVIDQHFAGAKKIKINHNKNCLDKNNIQFYY